MNSETEPIFIDNEELYIRENVVNVFQEFFKDEFKFDPDSLGDYGVSEKDLDYDTICLGLQLWVKLNRNHFYTRESISKLTDVERAQKIAEAIAIHSNSKIKERMEAENINDSILVAYFNQAILIEELQQEGFRLSLNVAKNRNEAIQRIFEETRKHLSVLLDPPFVSPKESLQKEFKVDLYTPESISKILQNGQASFHLDKMLKTLNSHIIATHVRSSQATHSMMVEYFNWALLIESFADFGYYSSPDVCPLTDENLILKIQNTMQDLKNGFPIFLTLPTEPQSR
jgi:hypothetical protein